MPAAIYEPEETPDCPHCGKPMEDPAESFVIPGRTGWASEATDNCWECGEPFKARKLEDGYIQIERK